MKQRKKLNILQQGILQPVVFGIVGAICLTAMGIVFYYIGKYNVFKNSDAPAIDIVGVAVVLFLFSAMWAHADVLPPSRLAGDCRPLDPCKGKKAKAMKTEKPGAEIGLIIGYCRAIIPSHEDLSFPAKKRARTTRA